MHYIGNDMITLCPGSTGDGGCKGRHSDVLTSPVKLEAQHFLILATFTDVSSTIEPLCHSQP